jgi:Retroviral aspartyl protease
MRGGKELAGSALIPGKRRFVDLITGKTGVRLNLFMSIIKIPIRYEGSKGETVLYTLFDSGATFSCISVAYAAELANLEKMRHPMEIATAAKDTYLRIENVIRLDFYYNDIRLSDEFLVIDNISEDVILGANTLQKWRIKLDFEHDTIIVNPKVAKAILK